MNRFPSEQRPPDHFPPGAKNAFYFQFFNTASFGTITGVPMILFFKELGASVFLLGIVASIPPLLIILQIPASRYVERIGYRSFVLKGWMLRTFFSLGVVLAALLPSSVSTESRILIAIFFLIGYNVFRGISTCGFMPWMSQLIPEEVRGRFVATDQMTGSIAGLFATLLIAAWLHFHSNLLGYAVVFIFSAVTGFISIRFLRRIPDVPVPEEAKIHRPIQWRNILNHPSFKKILMMNFIFQIAAAGGSLLWIPLMKDHFGKSSDLILCMVAFTAFLAIGMQYISSGIVDRTGSKPALIFAILMSAVHFVFWSLIAAHLLPVNWISLFIVQLTAAMAFPLFNIANTRLVMSAAPEMTRSHCFAIFSVTVNLTLGLFPWFWGYGVDHLKSWNILLAGSWHGNAYSLCYTIGALIFIAAWLLLLKIKEPQSLTAEQFIHELFVKTPQIAISRILNRRFPL